MVEVGFYAPSHANQNRLRPDSLRNFACNGMWMVCTSILSRVVPKRFEAQPGGEHFSLPRALCRLQWHPMAWHYNLRVRHWRVMRKWCGAPWIRSSQWDFHGFPYVWISFGGHHWLMLKYAFQGLFFLCSSARHHRMCSLDLIRPYLKHPFPGRKGPSFLNSCNLQFHINVGSWLVWGPPPQTNSNLVYWIIRSFFPPPPQQFFWIVNLSKDFNWFQFTFNWNQFTFKWFQFTFNWNQFTFNLLSIDFNLLSIDFNLLSIDFNLLSIDFNLLSIDFNLLSIGFNLLSIDFQFTFNWLSIYFQLISIYFRLISIYFQLISIYF